MLTGTAVPPLLTIGIPTYSRRDTVVRRVDELLLTDLSDRVEVLVVDNDSPDGTYVTLAKRSEGTSVRVLKNEKNLGFAGSFLRLFREARGEYLLITSDEDAVLGHQLPKLLRFCEETRPTLVSPQVFMTAPDQPNLYRGRRVTSRIRPCEFTHCAFYVSGVTFHVASAAPFLALLEGARGSNSAVDLYPQELLSAALLARGRGHWLAAPMTDVTDPVSQLPTHARDLGGGAYTSLSSRWQQHLDRDAFLGQLRSGAENEHERECYEEMITASRRELYLRLRIAIAHERPDMANDFDQGARRFLLERHRSVRVMAHALRDPRETLARLRHRL